MTERTDATDEGRAERTGPDERRGAGGASSTEGGRASGGPATASDPTSPSRDDGTAADGSASTAGESRASGDGGSTSREAAGGGAGTDDGIAIDDSRADESRSGTDEERSVTFDGPDAASSGSDSSDPGTGDAAADDGSPPQRPSGADDPRAQDVLGSNTEAYRKVIRLLQNREFPVSRAEIEDLASNAYQLSPRECSDAVDAIIQKGLLEEENGTLKRPPD